MGTGARAVTPRLLNQSPVAQFPSQLNPAVTLKRLTPWVPARGFDLVHRSFSWKPCLVEIRYTAVSPFLEDTCCKNPVTRIRPQSSTLQSGCPTGLLPLPVLTDHACVPCLPSGRAKRSPRRDGLQRHTVLGSTRCTLVGFLLLFLNNKCTFNELYVAVDKFCLRRQQFGCFIISVIIDLQPLCSGWQAEG